MIFNGLSQAIPIWQLGAVKPMLSSLKLFKKPCIVINVENEYSSVVLAGTLWMKGCDVHLANSSEECLKIIKDLNRVDVVIIGAEFAMDRAAMLIGVCLYYRLVTIGTRKCSNRHYRYYDVFVIKI